MDKVIIAGREDKGTKYCILENDGVGLCVCKHRPCEQLQRLKEENYQLQKDCQICENFIDFIPCKPIRDMDYDLQKVISQRDNYYQALQEIRDKILSPEIIDEETKKLHTSEELDNIVRWHREDKLSKIKAKINEVIGAEE